MRSVAAQGAELAGGWLDHLPFARFAWRRSRVRRALEFVWRALAMFGALPRGTARFAALGFVALFAGYGITLSGQGLDLLDDMTRNAGLAVETIEISGQRQVREADVMALLGVKPGMSLLAYNLDAGYKRLLTNPWIESAMLTKLYPGELKVTITEKQPFALYEQTSGDPVYIIKEDGQDIVPYTPGQFAGLPLMIGVGANLRMHEVLDLIHAVSELAPRVRASLLVSERRWDLVLDNGLRVMLPEEKPVDALKALVALDKESQILARDLAVVDLRLPDRVVLRLGDTALQQHQAAVAAAAKSVGGHP